MTDSSSPAAPRFETRAADWIDIAEAQARVVESTAPLAPEAVPLALAYGRYLADDAEARADMPPWDNSAMDGYAVRAADIGGATPEAPRRLEVVGKILAGSDERPAVGPGQACRIMTGAPVPEGADTVVRVEDTDAEASTPGRVEIQSDRDAGRNVRPGGQDMRAGDVVVPASTCLTPGWVAALGTAGHDPVRVRRRPLVAILTGGDELRPTHAFDDVLAGRAIPDSNAPMLASAVTEAGGTPLLLGPARDDPDDLRRLLALAAEREADLVVTVGGASMGEADLLKRTLDEDGFDLDFWRIRMRPGSPVAFGWLPERRPLLSLPGNPASAWVTFLLLARPMLRRMVGDPEPFLRVGRATAGEPLRSVERLCHFHRVSITDDATHEGLPVVRLSGHTSSGLVQSLGPADALAVVPEGLEAIEAGREIEVLYVAGEAGSPTPGFVARV